MSTQKGNGSRTRAQKHKNRTVFKNDLHDKTPQQKKLNSLHISEVCQHCKGVIEWKIKYKKYKALTQQKTCTRCQQRNIRKAYHVLCRGCALETRVCAKCLKSAEEVAIEPAQPTREEELKLKVEMDRLVKSFPERKRRAFLRFMEKGKKDKDLAELEAEAADETEGATAKEGEEGKEAVKDDAEENVKHNKKQQLQQRVPHSRDELLQKIEQLKLAGDDDFDTGSDSDDYEDSENEHGSDADASCS